VPEVGLEPHSNPWKHWDLPKTYRIRGRPADAGHSPRAKVLALSTLLFCPLIQLSRPATRPVATDSGSRNCSGIRSMASTPTHRASASRNWPTKTLPYPGRPAKQPSRSMTCSSSSRRCPQIWTPPAPSIVPWWQNWTGRNGTGSAPELAARPSGIIYNGAGNMKHQADGRCTETTASSLTVSWGTPEQGLRGITQAREHRSGTDGQNLPAFLGQFLQLPGLLPATFVDRRCRVLVFKMAVHGDAPFQRPL